MSSPFTESPISRSPFLLITLNFSKEFSISPLSNLLPTAQFQQKSWFQVNILVFLDMIEQERDPKTPISKTMGSILDCRTSLYLIRRNLYMGPWKLLPIYSADASGDIFMVPAMDNTRFALVMTS